MEKNFTFLLLFFLALPGFSADLTLSRISVVGTETTDPAVVRSAFVEVSVGDSLSEDQLAEAAQRAKDRLVGWGYFGSVDVLVVRSKSKPGTAALVAEVTEGFLYRFGGGPIWGSFGSLNLGGQAKEAAFWLGWNQQAVAWTDRAPGWKGGRWTMEAGNRPRGWIDAAGVGHEIHALGGSGSLVHDWGWGWETGVRVEANGLTDVDYRGMVFQAVPGAWLGWSAVPPGFSPDRGVALRAGANAGLPDGWVRYQGDARAYLPLMGGLKTAFRGVATAQTGEFVPRDAVLLSGLDGVRKAFDASDRGRAAAWTSAELRWAAMTIDLFGFTAMAVEPALVFDSGLAWDKEQGPVSWAGGLAFRLFLAAPVSLPLRLEGTIDDGHHYRIGFGASAPF